MCVTQQQLSSLLLKLHSESWLSSTHNPSGHKREFEWSPKAGSQGPIGPARDSPTSASARISRRGPLSPFACKSRQQPLAPRWAGWAQSKPGTCSPEPSCCLKPVLALAVHDELLAGMGDVSRQLFLISSRARQ